MKYNAQETDVSILNFTLKCAGAPRRNVDLLCMKSSRLRDWIILQITISRGFVLNDKTLDINTKK